MERSGAFAAALVAAYEGRARFDDVVRQHRAYFRALAAQIMRRWRLPPWVHLDDVEQDLIISAWEKLWSYEPERGTRIDDFVVWNAYDRVKKRAHKLRGAKRSGNKADSNPSRFERNVSSMMTGDPEADEGRAARLEARVAVPPPQESGVRLLEVEDEVQGCARTLREWHAVRAARELGELEDVLAGDSGALARAARAIYEDPDAREECEYGNEDEAQCGTVIAAARVRDRVVDMYEPRAA